MHSHKRGRRFRRQERGFSLIELVTVLGLIAVLIALLIPAVLRSRESARTVQCAAQLYHLGQALHQYASVHQQHLPPWSGWHVAGGNGTGDDDPGPGWTEMLAPWYVPPTNPAYNCPSFPEGYPINYFLSSRYLRQNFRHSLLLSEVSLSSEFVLSGDTTHGHLYPPPFGWALFTSADCDKDDAVGPALVFFGEDRGFNVHHAGNNVLFADGHVRAFKQFDPQAMTFDPHIRGVRWDEVAAKTDSTQPTTSP